jgi:hypothetical protein
VTQQADWIPDSVDLGRPSTARMYDYILGGGHNLEADRVLVEKMLAVQPEIRRIAYMNRAFLRRAVLFMVDAGIRQFLDLGSGIPTVGNVHEIAQGADPECRVVYVDNEPIAVAHSQLVLRGNEHAVILQADITEPRTVLTARETQRTIDFTQPVGVLAITIGHHIAPDRHPSAVFAAYREAVVPGSFFAMTHWTSDLITERGVQAGKVAKNQIHIFPRTRTEIAEFFGDFELVEPGLVTTSQWRPDRPDDVGDDATLDAFYAGVARKP